MKDGHIHTPFCPHGTKDSLKAYVEKALERKIEEISFTEHMPLPNDLMDVQTRRECALLEDEVPAYFEELEALKQTYEGKIKINKGFEVDYIEGYEAYIKEELERYGEELEDSILSVHFLKVEQTYYALDLEEGFKALEKVLGSREKVYDLYFETVLKSIKADLGKYKPKRIGHPTLIRVFNQKYPLVYKNEALIEKVVKAIKEANMEVDFNHSGLRKPLCKETCPSGVFLELVKAYGIKWCYGSDSHASCDVGR